MSSFDEQIVSVAREHGSHSIRAISQCQAFQRFEAEHRERIAAIERADERRLAERIAAIKAKDAVSRGSEMLFELRSAPCP